MLSGTSEQVFICEVWHRGMNLWENMNLFAFFRLNQRAVYISEVAPPPRPSALQNAATCGEVFAFQANSF